MKAYTNTNLISNRITHTFPAGRNSIGLIVPREFAVRHGFDKPVDVILEALEDESGFVVKKFVLPNTGENK